MTFLWLTLGGLLALFGGTAWYAGRQIDEARRHGRTLRALRDRADRMRGERP